MPITYQNNNSIQPNANTPLTSQIFSKKDNIWLDVIPVRDKAQCTRTDCAYIVMTAYPQDSSHILNMSYNNQKIGRAELHNKASYIAQIDNLSPKSFERIGTALTEITCRLALLHGSSTVNLYAIHKSVPFHYKMGARFSKPSHNNSIQNALYKKTTLSSLGLKGHSLLALGDMQIDLRKLSSGPQSPRLMPKLLETEIKALKL